MVIPINYPDRRPPAGDWLAGAAVAVLSFDVDAESPILAELPVHWALDGWKQSTPFCPTRTSEGS